MLGIVNLHLRVEKLADIFLVILRGNPSLTELQTDVVKGNLLGQRLLQCGLGLLQGGNDHGVIGMFLSQFNGIVHIGQLIIDIAGEGLAADFVAAIGHVIDTSFQLIDQIGLRMASDTGHILQVHLTIAVQRGKEGFLRRIDMADLIGDKGHGTLEDVGLDKGLVNGILQRQHVTSLAIVHDGTGILALVEIAELLDKLVVILIQLRTEFRLGLTGLCLGVIEFFVGIANLIVELHTLLILGKLLGLFLLLDCWLCLLHFLTVPHGKEVELDGGTLLHLLHLRLRLNLLNWLRLLLHDFRGICLIIVHEVLIQVTLEILSKQFGYPLHTAVMGANQCRLAVGVGAFLHLRGHDSLRIRGHHRLPPVAVHRDVRPVLTAHRLEAGVHVAESLCVGVERHIIACVFLENYQI